MKTEMINEKIENALTLRWWNPLSWVATVFAPVFGIIGGIVLGCIVGLLIGYQRGLEQSCKNMSKIINSLP